MYRDFILSGAYLPYRTSFIEGLRHYGRGSVALRLDSRALLTPASLFEGAGIEPDEAAGYHPIAVLSGSTQLLVIATEDVFAPVHLLHHETGVFYREFDAFIEFVAQLERPADVRRKQAAVRHVFAEIRKTCGAAVRRATAALAVGRLEPAANHIDAALAGRSPIPYDGANDFEAIGLLCQCFDLRGTIRLALGDYHGARAAFLQATACGGRPWWQAAVDLVVSSFLLDDPAPAAARIVSVDTADFPEPPSVMAARRFTPEQLDMARAHARARLADPSSHAFAEQVLTWLQ